jgi:Ca2+-binding EF-hand superfamily protein
MLAKFATIITLSVSFASGNLAYADAGHHDKDETGSSMQQMEGGPAPMMTEGQSPMMGRMMGHNHQDMMKMMMGMMKMHGGMMNGAMMGSHGERAGSMRQMGMMDRDMINLMHKGMRANIQADADGNGSITPEESADHMKSMHVIADKNGDGAVTLDEFEAFHSMMIRNRMVDRFQHLDENGDGMVTSDEMEAPANRMKMGGGSENMSGKK